MANQPGKNQGTKWATKSMAYSLRPQDLHIWHIRLDVDGETLAGYKLFLSEDELIRADRFRFERDRRRYTAGRGILRVLLGRYLQSEPEAIRFQYTKYGKPYLLNSDLQFNSAHSQDKALLGFCITTKIGVDIECIRPIENITAIASRFFSLSESNAILTAPVSQQLQLFFSYWTLKEAFIKGVGRGLSYPLDAFEIDLANRNFPRLKIKGDKNEEERWTLFIMAQDPDCPAAVAVQGNDWQLVQFKFKG